MPKKYFIFFGILILLTPLGLLADGAAWGEWGAEELHEMMGFVPAGIEAAGHWWEAIFPDYSIPSLAESPLGESTAYIVSAIVGSLAVYALTSLAGKFLVARSTKTVVRINK